MSEVLKINQKNKNDRIQLILKEKFGFESLRFEQEKVILSLLDKKDTLVIMPTGGGKSLCYQLPALYFSGVTLVISPLISLMQDQVDNLALLGIAAGYLNSTQSSDERQSVLKNIKSGEIKIVYIAPEGILNLYLLEALKKMNVSLIAIDEAHCVSQWGHEFRQDYTRLDELKLHFPEVPTLALTATADSKTRQDIIDQLGMSDPNVFVSTFDRPNIRYMIFERENELKQLDRFIATHHTGETGIVYCLSRNKVERIADELCKMGYAALPYHAGMPSRHREKTQRRFKSEEGVIVVATIAFGMGIDRPDVRFVAHLDLPKSIEGYYQETGRAGRDGEPANAWMVYGLADVVKLARMLETTQAEESYKKIARNKLNSMLSLCEAQTCRRKILLEYFGQESQEFCGNCDACLDPPKTYDASVEVQKLLSTIYRTGQIFGSGYVIDVLRGSQNAKILERNHHELSVYGIGKNLSKSEWNAVIRQLLNLGFIYIKDWDFKNLALAEKCRGVLKGKEKLFLREFRKVKTPSRGNRESSKSKKKSLDFTHGRENLFERLRQLRLEIAQENKVPPYIIFSDKTLHDMCSLIPSTKEQMLMVHGVGASKLEKYGDPFLAEIVKEGDF